MDRTAAFRAALKALPKGKEKGKEKEIEKEKEKESLGLFDDLFGLSQGQAKTKTLVGRLHDASSALVRLPLAKIKIYYKSSFWNFWSVGEL